MKKRDILRQIPDGETLTLRLSDESWRAWYNRAWEINQEDGWAHYIVSKNVKLNTILIKANPKPS